MKRKIVVGISSYAGSDTSQILTIVQILLSFKHKVIKTYSLKECKIDRIISMIQSDSDDVIHVIKHISDKRQAAYLKKEFAEPTYAYNSKGIEVPWEDCFANFVRRGLLPKNTDRIKWRNKNESDPYRLGVLACHKEIGTRNDNIYLCQDGSYFSAISRFVDDILLML
jgi:hypothetical protein